MSTGIVGRVPVIDVRDLQKTYGDVTAVAGVTFSVEPGEVFALLGPNGAGKSTTVEILEGHRTATAGHVRVLGVDPADADRTYRDRIGIVLQSAGIERELSVREALELYGSYYRRPRPVGEVLDLVGLGEKADDRVKTLSGGQQRRIDLALGIIGDPEVLFLDEPTTGFDPSARRRSWDLLSDLRSLGTTILLTTHYMDEAQHLADRVGVIADGRIVASGTPDELIGVSTTTVSFRLPPGTGGHDLPALPAAPVLHGPVVEYATDEPTATLYVLTRWAMDRGEELTDLSVHRPSLEDIYLQLTEREARP